MVYILLEYKDKEKSGAQGRIAVWLFTEEDAAKTKMGELTEKGLELALYKAEPVVYFGV